MKKKLLLPFLLLLLLTSTSCKDKTFIGESEHKDYVSAYTQEEHILRISEYTKINFMRLEQSDDMDLDDFTVEIVYSIYDNDPEYFLVQVQLLEMVEFENTAVDKLWYLGIIQDDTYHVWDYGFGLNFYAESGNGEAKKYFGSGRYAVDMGDGELKELEYNKETGGWDMVALTEEEKSTYGEFNDPCGGLYNYKGWRHVEFQSEYMEEDHLWKISQQTEKLFSCTRNYSTLKYCKEMELLNYTVEIVYSIYDNDSEFFIVQANLENSIVIDGVALPVEAIWYLGIIQNDEYYIWDCGYGLNPYKASGADESKKYYGYYGHYAVQTGDNELTEINYNEKNDAWERRIMTTVEKELYGEFNCLSDYDKKLLRYKFD